MSNFTGKGERVPGYVKEAIDSQEEQKDSDTEEKESKEDERLKKFQEKAINLLELYGLVEQKEKHTIVDLEQIKDFSNRLVSGKPTAESYRVYGYENIKDSIGYDEENPSERQEDKLEDIKTELKEIGHKYFDFFKGDARHFLLSAFKDKKVVAKKDFKNEEVEEKSLFYHPKNKEEAFNKEKIKNADFHMGAWEIDTHSNTKAYSPFIEDLDHTEISLAAVIYNRSYGDGKREGGNLTVRAIDSETGEYSDTERQRITKDWLVKDNRFYGVDFRATKLWSSPREALEEGNYENLQENNILRPGDFEAASLSEVAQKYGLYKEVVNKKGNVALEDDIRYGLGSKFGSGDYAVASIGKDSYGIIKLGGNKEPIELEAIVDKVDPEKEKVKQELKDDAGNLQRIGKRSLDKLGHIHELSEEDGWSDIGIAEILEAKKEVVYNTNVSLEELSQEELRAFLNFYRENKENQPESLEDVYDFVKTYGKYGLRSFASLESSDFSGEDLINIMHKTETRADAIPIFRKYSEIMDKANGLEEKIRLFFKQEEKQDIDKEQLTFEIEERATQVLVDGIREVEEEKKSYKEVEASLEDIDEEIVTFTSIFKTAFKGEEEIDFETVKGLDFESKKINEINEEDKKEMIRVSEDNWKQRESGKDVYENLEEMLKQENTESNFHILKKDGDVVAFVRMDPPESGHKYAASLNVDPNYRGSAIGEAMLKNTLAKEAEDYVIDATVFPELKVGTKYVEGFDFNIVGTGVYGEEEKPIFKIRIDKKKNERLKTKDKEEFTYNKIKEEYEDKAFSELDTDQEVIIRKYDVESEYDDVVKEVGDLTSSGYKVTRYFTDDESKKNRENESEPVRYFVFEKTD